MESEDAVCIVFKILFLSVSISIFNVIIYTMLLFFTFKNHYYRADINDLMNFIYNTIIDSVAKKKDFYLS